jgi:NADPH:quinone reductase-like Zn-dependent oxidoreductase
MGRPRHLAARARPVRSKPRRLDILVAAGQCDAPVAARVAVVANVAVVAVGAEVEASVRRVALPHQAVVAEKLSEIAAAHVDEDLLTLHPVPNVLTAWRMLISKAAIKPGEDILILGIGGGVATAVLQIVKAIGLRAFVTSSSDDKLQQAQKLGADGVINYKTQDVSREIRTLTNRRGVDVVVDSVGGDSYSQSLASLVKGGRLVTCGATAGPRPQTDLQRIFWNQLSVFGSTMGNRREFAEMLSFVRKRSVKPVIDQVVPLAEGANAFARMEEGKQFGKIALKVGDGA